MKHRHWRGWMIKSLWIVKWCGGAWYMGHTKLKFYEMNQLNQMNQINALC